MILLRIHRLCLTEDRATWIFEGDAEFRGIKAGKNHALERHRKYRFVLGLLRRQSFSINDAFIDVEERRWLKGAIP